VGKRNEDVVSITRAVRAGRIARAQSMSGPPALSRSGVAEDALSANDQTLTELDLEDLEPGVFGSPESVQRATEGTNPMAKQLVEDHLWLVDRLAGQAARRFPRYVERNELWSAGVLGLVEAARRYDSSYNVPFAAYASARVRGEMLETARSADLAPRRLRRSLRELAEVVEGLTQTLGRVPSLAEVATAAQIDVGVVRDRLQTASNLVSSSLDDSNGSSQSDNALATITTEPTEKLSQQELLGALREAVSELPEPLKSVLVRSHWNNERLVDIAEDMGISFQRVAQYKVEAITALAAWFATLYEAVPAPDAGLPGAVRRAAFCSSLAARSTWRTRLEAGVGQREELAEVLSGLGVGASADS
jgi:RNA polymerase sigma factor for flagellar operon FliA